MIADFKARGIPEDRFSSVDLSVDDSAGMMSFNIR